MRFYNSYSRGQQLCKFIGTKESVYLRKEFNSHRIGLEHQDVHRGRHVKTLYTKSKYYRETWGQLNKTFTSVI